MAFSQSRNHLMSRPILKFCKNVMFNIKQMKDKTIEKKKKKNQQFEKKPNDKKRRK